MKHEHLEHSPRIWKPESEVICYKIGEFSYSPFLPSSHDAADIPKQTINIEMKMVTYLPWNAILHRRSPSWHDI